MISWVDHVLWHASSVKLAGFERCVVEGDDSGIHVAEEPPGLTFMLLTFSAPG